MSENFEDLKVGDEVVVRRGHSYATFLARKVERLTDKQIVVNGSRYWKENGFSVGKDTYTPLRILRMTDANRALCRTSEMQEWWQSFQRSTPNVEVIEAIKATVDAMKARKFEE